MSPEPVNSLDPQIDGEGFNAVNLIFELARDDPDGETRAQAISFLYAAARDSGSPEKLLPFFLDLMDDKESKVASEAAEAYTKLVGREDIREMLNRSGYNNVKIVDINPLNADDQMFDVFLKVPLRLHSHKVLPLLIRYADQRLHPRIVKLHETALDFCMQQASEGRCLPTSKMPYEVSKSDLTELKDDIELYKRLIQAGFIEFRNVLIGYSRTFAVGKGRLMALKALYELENDAKPSLGKLQAVFKPEHDAFMGNDDKGY